MKQIAYTLPDGTVSVLEVAAKARRKGESDADFLTRIAAKSGPRSATNVVEIEEADLPYKGGLRNAWRQSGAAPPHIDMAEARKVKLARLREERNERLAALDGVEMRERALAEEAGDRTKLDAVLAKKKALRDMPEAVAADTRFKDETDPAVLDAFRPDELADEQASR